MLHTCSESDISPYSQLLQLSSMPAVLRLPPSLLCNPSHHRHQGAGCSCEGSGSEWGFGFGVCALNFKFWPHSLLYHSYSPAPAPGVALVQQ